MPALKKCLAVIPVMGAIATLNITSPVLAANQITLKVNVLGLDPFEVSVSVAGLESFAKTGDTSGLPPGFEHPFLVDFFGNLQRQLKRPISVDPNSPLDPLEQDLLNSLIPDGTEEQRKSALKLMAEKGNGKILMNFLKALPGDIITSQNFMASLNAYQAKPIESIFFNADTNHFYEFVPGYYTWQQAKVAAEARTHNGLQGYLATITSALENNFIVSNLGVSGWGGWIGASDAQTEGIWKWVTGPEKGKTMGYNNFLPGEPDNNLGIEDYAHIWTWGKKGTWNDLPNDPKFWVPHIPEAHSIGYYVEYGGMEPPKEPKPVPEPSAMLGLLTFSTFGFSSILKRKRQQKVLNSVES